MCMHTCVRACRYIHTLPQQTIKSTYKWLYSPENHTCNASDDDDISYIIYIYINIYI